MSRPTAEDVRRIFNYDPETGEFRWRLSPNPKVVPGQVAGYVNKDGRRRIGVNGRFYKAHRLAWLYVHGRWPSDMLDHVNGQPDDNRICNLREASRAENGMNRQRGKNNKSGYKGVHWHANNRSWRAQITACGRQRFLGSYSSAEEAHQAYVAAARELHGEFARTD